MGAPRPLVKSIQMLSTGAPQSAASVPDATVALKRRAPSVCTGTDVPWATSATARYCASGHTVPPPKLWVCSRQSRRAQGR